MQNVIGACQRLCFCNVENITTKKPDDFVIATKKQYSIKDFINLVAKQLKLELTWKGKGINEKAYDKNKRCIILCSKKYFRPAEVDSFWKSKKSH